MNTDWFVIRPHDLPRSWTLANLHLLSADVRPGFASGRHSREACGQVPHLRPMNVALGGHLDLRDIKYVSAEAGQARLAPGDVLFNNTNSPDLVGKTAHFSLDGDFAFSNHMTRIRLPETVSPRYVAYQLQLLQLAGYFRHVCLKHVNQASVSSSMLTKTVPLAIAPLAEQERVVAAIEEQISRLDDAERLLRRARVMSARMHTAVIASTVGRGWPTKPLGAVLVSLRNGIFVSRPSKEPPGVRIFRISAVRPLELKASAVRYAAISEDEASPYLVAPGDLLFTRYSGNSAYVGSCAVVPAGIPPTVHPDKLIRVVVDRGEAIPDYVAIAVNFGTGRREVEARLKTTAGQVGIAGGQLRTVEIPLPPLDEQERLVSEVDRQRAVCREVIMTIDHALTRSSRLRRAVLERAFSGRLVPQNPNDEPASVLLERIKTERVSVKGTGGQRRRVGTVTQ